MSWQKKTSSIKSCMLQCTESKVFYVYCRDLSGNDIVYLDETVFRDTTELKYL